MHLLKQSTAATIKLGPFVDDTDGKTAETALTIAQADIRLSKNGGDIAQSNNSAGATHDELGYYDIPLDATDTNTLGRLDVIVSESGALPVRRELMVLPANVFDSLVGGSDNLQVDAVQVGGTTQTAGDVAALLADVPTVSEFEARTLVAGNYFDPTADSVAINASSVQAIRVEIEDPANMMAAIQTAVEGVPTNAEFAAALPANFASMAITVGGAVTVGTNSDKTGYSLTQSFPANFASMSIDANGRLDVIKVAGTTQTAGDIYGAVPGLVWDIVLASHLTAGSTGAGLNAAGSAGDPWSTALPGAYGSGSAGKIVGDALASHVAQSGDSYARIGANGASLTALATQASVNVVDANVDLILADTGTDGVVVSAASVRSAVGLAAANLDTQLADLPTVAEFNARTLAAAAYFQVDTAYDWTTTNGTVSTTVATP